MNINIYCLIIIVSLVSYSCRTSSNNITIQYSTNPSKLECVNFIISKDDSLGRVRNHACEKISLSNSIDKYVSSINALNFNNCPKDFSLAFEKHINAWSAMKKVTDRFPNLRGEMHDLFNKIGESEYKQTFDILLKDIWSTWESVEMAVENIKQFKVAYNIDEPDLVPEGIAHNPKDNSFYIGSTWKRKILKIEENGKVSNFVESGQDGLLGIIGMKIDIQRQILWVCTSSSGKGMPVKGLIEVEHNKSGIFQYDLKSKKLINQFWLEKDRESFFFNDLTISKSGQVFATEMRTRSIYTVKPNEDKLKHFASLPEGFTANGIDIDNKSNNLFLALYAKPNSFGKMNMNTKKLKLISIPIEEKVGADGLYFYNNSLIAVQPFIENRAVTQYFLNSKSDRVKGMVVLLTQDKILNQPTTGVISGQEFYLIANSQLQKFSKLWNDNEGGVDIDDLQPIKIIKIPLRDY